MTAEDTAVNPRHLRASDDEREAVVERLRDAAAEGRMFPWAVERANHVCRIRGDRL
ncbi:DUF1707 domain-containing protein [Streptomyces sp. NPDC033754]|uniref:DUF1707 domain-containing protein n=1 Tax=unclassified Streptomyces TaxID=2593676 RepID=UPI0033C45FA9